MSRNYQPVELNTFVGGLITEASPLTFPQNASLDEVNFVLNKNGSRSRRLGMDLEDNFVRIPSNYSSVSSNGDRLVVGSFKWDNAGGIASKSIIVVQVGNNLDFFDSDASPLSNGLIFAYDYGTNVKLKRFSFASVDGKLVVANGKKDIDIFLYDSVSKKITRISDRLLIRDLFGISTKTSDQTDLRIGSNVSLRPDSSGPKTAPGNHIYNLRNQTFAIPLADFAPDTPAVYDKIGSFYKYSAGQYPSNADNSNFFIYPNTDSGVNKIIPRYNAESHFKAAPGNSLAPIGYFIIDALDRGASRREQMLLLQDKYPHNNPDLLITNGIPTDSTPEGPACVCEYAGRVWYAGFPGDVLGGDDNSPKMSSYILFSQLVNDPTDIVTCYQSADPTDKDNSDLVDTDGGFLRVQGAYNITGMANLGNILVVFADNGVWSVTGGNNYGFTATNYKVTKITNSGCISPGSIVAVDNSILYWSRDGIYIVSQNQYGDYGATNLTAKTIQKYYNSIPEIVAKHSEGVYDAFEKQVKWVYYNSYGLDHPPTELVMDTNLGAFYKHEIKPDETGNAAVPISWPIVVKGIQTNPFAYSYADDLVELGSDQVVVGTDNVVVSTRQEIQGTKEVLYLILLGPYGGSPMSYTFGSYKNTLHYDWNTLVAGQDAASYLITGYLSGGDYQRNKQIIYLTVHCERTETNNAGDFTNQSSCLAQIQWNWSNSSDSNRWTRQFQTYRLFGPQSPVDPNNPNSSMPLNFDVVETRNKIRGTGKVISIKFSSEPGKHLTLLGWSINIGVNGNV